MNRYGYEGQLGCAAIELHGDDTLEEDRRQAGTMDD